MQKNLIIISLSLIASFGATSCTYILPEPHKIDIQQGNRVKQEDLDKLKVGMTRDQVKFVLGTPLLQDAFHRDRWDYLYYLKTGDEKVRQSRVSLPGWSSRAIRRAAAATRTAPSRPQNASSHRVTR